MAKFKVIIPFNFYKQGDIVGDAEYNKYGPQYFTAVSDELEHTADVPEPPKSQVITSADVITANVPSSETEKAVETKPRKQRR